MRERLRYVMALTVGLLAIPGLALATNGVLSDDNSSEVKAATATSVAEAISADDLVRACGVEGRYLVELEAISAIDEIQQAALNALRPICEKASLPLPPAPVAEGETIVETVTVVRTVPGPAESAAPASTTTTTMAGTEATVPYEEDDASEALEARAHALAAIDAAIASGGNAGEINEAIGLIERGDVAYEAGDYDTAEDLYEEAEDRAADAERDEHEYEEHDDYEDDEHEEEHEEEEEYETEDD